MTIHTKWPRLIVVGEPVTEQQANEILIRTCVASYLTVNERAWNEVVARAMGLPEGDDFPPRELEGDARMAWVKERWAAVDKRCAELGILPLEYLATSRISSSWIGGPKGWCDWDGTIGCSNYNIGKWPSTEEVTKEWQAIAAAFPYLRLDAQVVDDEGEGEIADQWHVADGIAELVEVGEPLRHQDQPEFLALSRIGWERGVSIERLREAVAQVAPPEASR